ncbi:MAG TPA: 5'-nucleotidase C-terminal domain-containing protein [Bacteroidales bacterium]|nr:5'-nucleotidase C-terminal domain-containing protein [Bacteroidales bacterium]
MKQSVICLKIIRVVPVVFMAVMVACQPVRQTSQKIPVTRHVEFLAVNDMHAAIDNFPHFAFIVDSLRTLYPDMLLVSAGDNQTGNPANDQYKEKGMPMIELMNAVNFDISAVGNHEFDSKPDGFAKNTQKAGFDFIGSNILLPEGNGYRIRPFKIITTKNGVRIAFVSLLNINEGGIPDSHPDNVKEFRFKEPYATAKEYLFLSDSCQVFVFLNHMGFEEDVALAGQLPAGKVDLIIGGHSHTRVDKEQIHNGILITQAERKLKYATLIKLTLNDKRVETKTMQLLTIGNKGNVRSDIRDMVSKYNNNPSLSETIAEATADFTSYEQVGYLMVDGIRAAAGADIALANPGGVRIDHLNKGYVSVKDIYTMDPFGNEMVLFKLSGHELRALHLAAFTIDDSSAIYPSGMKSKYQLTDKGALADVQFFTNDGKPLEMDKTYTVVMNNYMSSVYNYEHQDSGHGLFRTTAEGIIDYLKKLKKIPDYQGEKRVEVIKTGK